MNKCLIITSYVEKVNSININKDDYNFVICADGGLLVANKLNIDADILIGDYDSMECPSDKDIIKLPMEKDMTDTEAALDLAVSKGFEYIEVLGGLGGRLDHTLGNLGMLCKYCNEIHHLVFFDGMNYTFMLTPGTYKIPKNLYKYLGIISYSNDVKGLTLSGTKYTLNNVTLTNDTSLGVSNEIKDDFANITFTDGLVLVVLSKDNEN